MKAASKTIPVAGPLSDEFMRIEDRIMARALALWHGKGRGHRSAADAWLQAERELLLPESKRRRSVKSRPVVKISGARI